MKHREAEAAGRRLAALLTQENAALQALDFTTAGALLAEKHQLAETLAAALREAAPIIPLPQELMVELARLAEENARALTRAMRVQRRVLALIADAARANAPAGSYDKDGGARRGRRANLRRTL